MFEGCMFEWERRLIEMLVRGSLLKTMMTLVLNSNASVSADVTTVLVVASVVTTDWFSQFQLTELGVLSKRIE